ncbi:hypothetical protein B0H13DRAFT_2021282 [Mycena leptocephala]|nr:hypothetical protein B0H13DRAFT_2050360 [Mycena leptocephala]KAJ7906232.1 hypothetical protein B0H13DRAFT_2021282 [Mycena leptocephala]
MSALFGVLFFHTPILAQSIRPSAHRSRTTACVPDFIFTPSFRRLDSSSPPSLIRLDLTVLLGVVVPPRSFKLKISCVYTLLASHSSPCLFDLTAYNHLNLQCMCDGPSSCMNGCPATMPAAAGCRIGCSISADHRNMHYSRSVRRPSHKVLCDSTSATIQFLRPMTPLPLCVVDGCRVWLDRRVRRIRPI